MSSSTIIQCKNSIAHIAGFQYDGEPLTFDACAGEIINIIGPDYSGKSAWVKMISGMERCASGDVSILGKSLFTNTRSDWVHLRKNIAFLEADTALLSAANVLQNIMIPALYHKTDTMKNIIAHAKRLIGQITADSYLDMLPAQLRKDQHYKVAIIRALILNPKAIILDSPFEHLDVSSAEQFKSFLLTYAEENNVLVIIVSHDVKFAIDYSDKIIFASKNQINIFNTANDIHSSSNPDINKFLKLNLQS